MVPLPHILVGRSGMELDNNCACPDFHVFRDLPAVDDASLTWVVAPGLISFPVSSDNMLCFSPAGDGSAAVLNQPAHRLLAHFQTPQPMHPPPGEQPPAIARRAVAHLIDCGLLAPAERTTSERQPANTRLSVWLYLTDACNLRCLYCYVPKQARVMPVEVGQAAVDSALRSAQQHGYRTLKLKYAGGEPTLVFDRVRTLHAYAVAEAARCGVRLESLLLSNGTHLSQAVIDFLRAEGVQLMLSLDGVGPVHDAQRPFAGGRGSFAAVAAAIDRCLDAGVTPHLSLTVTSQNIEHLAEAVDFALDRELRFNLNFCRDSDQACAPLAAADERLIDGVGRALQAIERRLPPYRLIDGLLDRTSFHAPHVQTCGAGRNYWAVSPDGQIARCQMDMGAAAGNVWQPDPLAAVRTPAADFQAVEVTERASCRQCPWQPWCGGGCPLQIFQSSGSWTARSPYCHIYQALLPAVLRLEGLRLLRWGQPLPLN